MASGSRERRPRRRPGQVIAESFARTVARWPPERRARAMRGWRGRILIDQIFRGMERQFDPERAGDAKAVVHWEIAREGEGADRRQLVIADGRCRAGRRLDREPTMTIKLDAVQLLELAAGVAAGPELFLTGRLRIEGDLMLAARLATFFRIPRPAAARD